MWWHTTGWFWWWLAFVLIFLLLPIGYGSGYRGWGPWYRRQAERRRPENAAIVHTPERRVRPRYDYTPDGWGWLAMALWFVLIVAVLWFLAALIS